MRGRLSDETGMPHCSVVLSPGCDGGRGWSQTPRARHPPPHPPSPIPPNPPLPYPPPPPSPPCPHPSCVEARSPRLWSRFPPRPLKRYPSPAPPLLLCGVPPGVRGGRHPAWGQGGRGGATLHAQNLHVVPGEGGSRGSTEHKGRNPAHKELILRAPTLDVVPHTNLLKALRGSQAGEVKGPLPLARRAGATLFPP